MGVACLWYLNYHFAMNITIDRAGRIVVPKALRDRFSLHPGAELEVDAVADGIRLRPLGAESSMVMKDGFLVHHGPSVAHAIDVADFINQQRVNRSIEISHLPQ